jgi:Tetratricopeptide repeat
LLTAVGINHPETLCTQANIAVLLTDQNDLESAETFFQKVLEGFTVTYGADNAETKRALHNLTVLQKRKRLKSVP